MIRSLSEYVPGTPYDVCIVGSGPAGLTLCAELVESGVRVCVLESGHDTFRDEATTLRDVGSPSLPIRPKSRERVFGGTSTTWSGLSAPFDDIDYDRNPTTKWPISRHELDPYLERAAERYGFPSLALFDRDEFLGDDRLAWRTLEEKVFVGTTSPQRFGNDLRHLFRLEGADLYLGATATTCVADAANGTARVTGISCRDEQGALVLVRADAYVLACGAIENARLLLHSELGTDRNQAGRYFMNHPKGYGATIRLNTARGLSNYFNKPLGEFFGYAGLRLTESVQRERGILNSYAKLEPLFPWTDRREIKSAKGLISAVKHIIKSLGAGRLPAADTLERIRQGVLALPAFAWLMILRLSYGRHAVPRRVRVRFAAEMEPSPENRVVLGSARDRFGIPVPEVQYEYTALDRESLQELLNALRTECDALGIGEVEADAAWIEGIREDASHHLGGTRMGDNPEDSVVDANLKVHGVDNLFVAGGSVFPTSGCANPTHMIVALSLRLAEHLRERYPHTPRKLPLSGQAPVIIIGSGRRVVSDVLPAFESLPKQYAVSKIFARRPRVIFGKFGTYPVVPLAELSADDVAKARVVYLAVPEKQVPDILTTLRQYPCSHLTLVLDTPVRPFKDHQNVLAAFARTWIAEDNAFVPWIETVEHASAQEILGPLRRIDCDRSVFRYHGIALVKALCGTRGEPGKILAGLRVRSRLWIWLSGVVATIREPRDYARGRLFITGATGMVADRGGPGITQLEVLTEGWQGIGFRIGSVETRLSDAERELLGPIADDDTVVTRMPDLKRVGLARLLAMLGEESSNLASGMEDARIDELLHVYSCYIDMPRVVKALWRKLYAN